MLLGDLVPVPACMTGSELAVRWGRLLVRHLWRSLPARIPPSTGESVSYVHERCLFYLATRQVENFLVPYVA